MELEDKKNTNKPSPVLPLNEFKEPEEFIIAPFRFDKDKSEWIQEQIPVSNIKFEIGHNLVFVTYNVWFDKYHLNERNEELFKIVNEKDPDVICFQEVVPEFIQSLINQKWVKEKQYYISDADGNFVSPYGVCILSKLPVTQYLVYSLPTQMGRNCIIANFKICDHSFFCATVHLESLNLYQYRENQLRIISTLLKKAHTALLMGDFNFDADINFSQHIQKCIIAEEEKKNPVDLDFPPLTETETLENTIINAYFDEYQDIWKHLRPTEKGYTFDSEINKMLGTYEQMRYDRILFKSEDNCWEPISIDLLGTERIANFTAETVYPSDHFGLVFKLQLKHQ